MGGMIPGPIAWRDVNTWCDIHGYDDEEREMLDKCVQAMDRVFLTWTAQQRNFTGTKREE